MKDIRLWGILIVALAVRTVILFSVFADVGWARAVESYGYEHAAGFIAWNGSLGASSDLTSPCPSAGGRPRFPEWSRPEIFRTPGYPALLERWDWILHPRLLPVPVGGANTSASQVFGSSLFSECPPETLKAVVSFQVLLDLHLVMLTFLLARSLAGHGTGLIAALFHAFSPLAAAASCRILPDSIFAFLLTAATLLLIGHFRTGRWWPMLTAALIMGCACYFQPVGLAFSAVMAIVLLCRPKRIRRTAGFAAVMVCCVAPWVGRNVAQTGYWGFSSSVTNSLYWYSAAEIEARRQQVSVGKIQQQFRRSEGWDKPVYVSLGMEDGIARFPRSEDADEPRFLTPTGLVRYRWGKAREIIMAHPWEFLRVHFEGDLAFWLPEANDVLRVVGSPAGVEGTGVVFRQKGLLAAARYYCGDNATAMVLAGVIVGILLIRYVGILLCGLWRLRPRMTAASWLCLLLVLTAWLLPGPANSPRFRVPVEPILSAAAAIGWLGLLDWLRRRRGAVAEKSNIPELSERV